MWLQQWRVGWGRDPESHWDGVSGVQQANVDSDLAICRGSAQHRPSGTEIMMTISLALALKTTQLSLSLYAFVLPELLSPLLEPWVRSVRKSVHGPCKGMSGFPIVFYLTWMVRIPTDF